MEPPPALVYLYGPPAVGKLTVAERVAQRTGWALFHNHLTVNAIREVFPFETPALGEVLHRLRLDVFATAARSGISLVFTNNSAWGGPDGRDRFAAFADAAARTVAGAGGRTVFVQLTAPGDVLVGRVAAASRAGHGKLVDPARLRVLLGEHVPTPLHPDDLVLDTSVLDPDDAAAVVVRHLQPR
jgi:predicted kinase